MADMDGDVRREGSFVVPELPLGWWSLGADSDGDADTMAPLIFNAWYVVALSTDVGRSLGRITVLGEPLVYYRTEDGRPIVLDDRCAHRRYPLSKGTLKGDSIQCGYHGFTYAASGQCVWAPGVPMTGKRAAGLPFGVRAYPCAEKGPWLWVWMGQPERANPRDIPLPEMQFRPESTICGYKMNPCNYMMVIENLLDLSHLHFVHDAADLESVAVVPNEAPAPPNGVAWKKVIEKTEMLLSAHLCGGDPKRLVREEDCTAQYGPSLTFGYARREALPGDTEPVKPELMQIAHAITPMDTHNTHQFFTMSMSDPFIIDKAEVLRVIQDVVFEQDVDVVREIQAHVDSDVRPGRTEFNMIYDRFGLKMRKILKDMKKQELRDA